MRPPRPYRLAAGLLLGLGLVARAGDPPAADPTDLRRGEELHARAKELFEAERHSEAEAPARESLALREASLGPDHVDVAECARTLARILKAQGRHGEARPLYERVLEIHEKALGPEHPDVAASLFNLAGLLRTQGEVAAARSLYERALAIDEKVYGPDHPEVATDLARIAGLLESQGQRDAARPLYERALAIREKALGPEDPEVAVSLFRLAGVLESQGDLSGARPLYERALAIDEKAYGPDHPEVATDLARIAGLLESQGQRDAARPLYERALAIREKALGPEDPEVATSLRKLARLLDAEERYDEARPLFERALRIREKALGAEHPDVAVSLYDLAGLLRSEGDTAGARSLCERALAIDERVYGPDHPEVATDLCRLAHILLEGGQYAASRACYDRALRIRESVLGPDHPDVAAVLNGLSAVLYGQGQYESARVLGERSVAIWEKAYGSGDPSLASGLGNLAVTLEALGRHDEARRAQERALAIREKTLGPEHPDVAISLHCLALALVEQGEYDAARPLYERALAIEEAVFGDRHPSFGTTLVCLAALLRYQGRYTEARSTYEWARSILEEVRGAESLDVARCVFGIAEVLRFQERFEAARPFYERALRTLETCLRRDMTGLQGAERLNRVETIRIYLDIWLRFAGDAGRTGYDEVLRLRGLATRAEAAERAMLRAGGEEARTRRDEILALDRELGGLAARAPRAPVEREDWRARCAGLAARREGLLLALARDYAPIREAEARFDVRLRDVQARLGAGDVLVDYLRTRNGYLAFVVPGDGEVVRLDLAEGIDEAAAAFVSAVAAGEAEGPSGDRLAALLFAPVRERLSSRVKRVFLCPDAALAAVPFAVLPGAKAGTFLVDEFEIVHVEMAQDLVPLASPPQPGAGVLVVGGVDYGKAEVLPSPAPSPLPESGGRAPEGGARWPELPGTAAEAELLRKRDDAVVLSGSAATEASFRAASRGKSILHLATHGYARTDRLARTLKLRDEARRLDVGMERQVAVGTDPMLLAGVVLAGADTGDGGEGDDGLLTAAEASWLNLEGVRLAVLSACETGRGTPAAGEGTLGLVRGFRLAGAQSVVASLWKVDDRATALWMERFYDALLDRGLEPPAAARAAAVAVREFTEADGKRPFALPRFWGAFVTYGR